MARRLRRHGMSPPQGPHGEDLHVEPEDSQTELEESHVQPQDSHVHPEDSNIQPEDSHVLPSASDRPSTSGTQARKKRGPTMVISTWAREGEQKVVVYDATGRPIGGAGGELITFLGTLARKSKVLPIHLGSWPQLPSQIKDDAFLEVEKRFTVNQPNARKRLMESLAKKWRDYKSDLKKLYYKDGDRAASMSSLTDPRVDRDQWAVMVEYWSSQEGQKVATTNKRNRENLTIGHTLGTCSFPMTKQKILVKEGVDENRTGMWVRGRTRSDGTILEAARKNKYPTSRGFIFR